MSAADVEARGDTHAIPPLTQPPLRLLQGRTVQPLKAAPLTAYRAVRDSGARPLTRIRLLVIHDEEAWTALSAARWFASRASQASAHECIDALEAYLTLPADRIPWAAPGANEAGYHLELAGYAAWTRAQWLERGRGTIERAAYRAALACRRYRIPLRWLTDPQLAAGQAGWTTHAQITRVIGAGGTHTDPGPGFPADLLLARAKAHAGQPSPTSTRYYTYRRDVPLAPGHAVAFTAGKGYYARKGVKP